MSHVISLPATVQPCVQLTKLTAAGNRSLTCTPVAALAAVLEYVNP